MPRKSSPPRDDPEQSKRFIELAEEVGANEDPEAVDRAFEKIVLLKKPGSKRQDRER
jgi:hypothetical protein